MSKEKRVAKPEKASPSNENHCTPEAGMPQVSFPVIGIGASAGGLEALGLFLENVPEESGMAYIVVQHLDPTRKGFLVDLLKRVTSMRVSQVEEADRIQPNCVYIIPPNKDMSLLHGALHLFDPAAPRGLRLPIDFLFRSLAEDLGERAIGVVLSGMGTDGTLGLKAIKEKGGAVLVQEPSQAKFDGMPKSAIDTGLVDIVASAEDLPAKMISYLKHKPLVEEDVLEMADSAFEKIVILLRSETGHDFSLYKKATIYRRVERRLGVHQIDDLTTYIRFLQENPQELQVLFKELLIGVTSFFRDQEAWQQLKAQAIPELLHNCTAKKSLRAWVPACSTGEEAYSLAMAFKEALQLASSDINPSLKIFATDLDREAIETARRGFYTPNIAADVSPERLRRFFIKEEHGYRVASEIRDMIVFAPQNVVMDPPFTKMDILSCRNLLIYLTPALQKKLLALFHHSLNPGGILFLGGAETIGDFTTFFQPLEGRGRLYQRLPSSLPKEWFEFPSSGSRFPPAVSEAAATKPQALKPITNLENLADQLILQHYSPPAVLVNEEGDILYTRGRTGSYLEPAAGKSNWNIFAMAPEGLRYGLSNSLREAIRQNSTMKLRNVHISTTNEMQTVNVTFQPVAIPHDPQRLVMIVFTGARRRAKVNEAHNVGRAPAERVENLQLKLEQTHQELLYVRTEMQSYREELLSAYEEMQSSNEELQSTNEELTTSKEELQSLNEELQTVNYELQMKVEALSWANNDLKNLLESTDIATLFLDNALCVRRFTTQTAKVFKLKTGDAGRPITDIVSDLAYSDLVEDARDVLRTLVFSEKEVTTNDGRWFAVRIMPYRTLENKIDGLVITFTDITKSKLLEAALRKTQAGLEKRLDHKSTEMNAKKLRPGAREKSDAANCDEPTKSDGPPEVLS